MIREQLEATGVVFDRLWELRFDELRNGAAVASRDYGFREAVASGDRATIARRSKIFANRLSADLVFLVSPSGSMVASDGAVGSVSADLQAALEHEETPLGVLPSKTVCTKLSPCRCFAPNMVGWIVVGERLDSAEMQALQGLSAIRCRPKSCAPSGRSLGFGASAQRCTAQRTHRPRTADGSIGAIRAPNGGAVALAKPLHSIDRGHVVLLLRYPMANAMQPYRALFGSLLAIGIHRPLFCWSSVPGFWLAASPPAVVAFRGGRQLQRGVYVPSGDDLGRSGGTGR